MDKAKPSSKTSKPKIKAEPLKVPGRDIVTHRRMRGYRGTPGFKAD